MNEKQTLTVIDNTFRMIFNRPNPYSLDDFFSKFAFDIRLPRKVTDSITGEETWSENINSNIFMTQKNMRLYDEQKGWMLSKRPIKNLNDIINLWKKINYTTTERQYDCINVSRCDPIYKCENAFNCADCNNSKNIVFCDGCIKCENMLASQRTTNSGFCLRVDDSSTCSNSYNVICSSNISNSIFIQDCSNLHECIFCSHISNHKFCISNMQFDETEYYAIKEQIINWIFSG